MLCNETSFPWKEGDREVVEVGSQALFLEEGARRAGDAPQRDLLPLEGGGPRQRWRLAHRNNLLSHLSLP